MNRSRGSIARHRQEEAAELDAKADADETLRREYRRAVAEVKAEGHAWGALQLHSEAMRRLGRGPPEGKGDRKARPRRRVHGLANSFKMGDLAGAIMRRTSHGARRQSGNDNMKNNTHSNEMLLGRRESTPAADFDAAAIASQALQDLELSDSEEEGTPATRSEARTGEGSGRRPSFLRRKGSKLGSSSGSSSTSIKLPKAIRRLSRRSSAASSDASSASAQKSNDMDDNDAMVMALADRKLDELESKASRAADGYEAAGATNGGSSRRRSSHLRGRRLGRRRSSLVSIDEKRTSLTDGNASDRLGNSNGSLPLVIRGGELICSFGRSSITSQSSCASIDEFPKEEIGDEHASYNTLLVGWGRRESELSQSVASNQENILSSSTLICGWDPHLSTTSQSSIESGVRKNEVAAKG